MEIEYCTEFTELTDLLEEIEYFGSFFACGARVQPMPRIEVEGVGILSFPLPHEQIQQLIRCATLAPFGRGEETIFDTSVRKVWQIQPSQFQISGASWSSDLQWILEEVVEQLGCSHIEVRAELYKMLIYDKGGFFKAHRDTEKSDGMFGTLTIVLPSLHSGGELIVRHGGEEQVIDLATDDPGLLSFAAFYADCEHEVVPVREGHRVCLIFNLVQPSSSPRLAPPLHKDTIEKATELLGELRAEEAPIKIAWLLNHHYTSAELSFAHLKGEDAAIAAVLLRAAAQADCALHLGIVHIEESGSAEIGWYDRRRRYEWDDVDDDEFEIIDALEMECYIDGWVGTEDQAVDLGKIPLQPDELLPYGELDGAPLDQQRVMEATGNEGASYERCYHRAALVLWSNERYEELAEQAGPKAHFLYLSSIAEPTESMVNKFIEGWVARISSKWYGWRAIKEYPSNQEMLSLLCRLQYRELLVEFLLEVVCRTYTGRENSAIVEASALLEPDSLDALVGGLVDQQIALHPKSCFHLLLSLSERLGSERLSQLAPHVLKGVARTSRLEPNQKERWDAEAVSLFLDLLSRCEESALEKGIEWILAHTKMFDERSILTPALQQLSEQSTLSKRSMKLLWKGVVQSLLARSKAPPKAPTDWAQKVRIGCRCEHCKELECFMRDPKAQSYSFKRRQEIRSHIESYGSELDLSFSTQREGTPHTLVCTKTHAMYARRCEGYRMDIDAMRRLEALGELAEEGVYLSLKEAMEKGTSFQQIDEGDLPFLR